MSRLSNLDREVWAFCAESAEFPSRSAVADRFRISIKRSTDSLKALRRAGKIKWGVSLAPGECAVLEQPRRGEK